MRYRRFKCGFCFGCINISISIDIWERRSDVQSVELTFDFELFQKRTGFTPFSVGTEVNLTCWLHFSASLADDVLN